MAEKRPNLGASVRAKLLNQSRASGQPFDLILVRFALERLLYRLSISAHAERFVLKGAMLLTTWFDDPLRPTRDLDLLGFGDPEPDTMQATFAEIIAIEVDDGILFNADSLRVDRIREAVDYGAGEPRRSENAAAIFGDALAVLAPALAQLRPEFIVRHENARGSRSFLPKVPDFGHS